jgi:hypothetical protein
MGFRQSPTAATVTPPALRVVFSQDFRVGQSIPLARIVRFA